ncbi:unnamed protein product [Polarella glacialis]|uniref:Uncharacterized protein n=1 Tax=Polarella glacialis TaxID=89957 RepID=A0A813G9U7_POLGL|nr:unnamed protein product [Polarella glacialis]
MFEPAGVHTLLRMRSSLPARPATSLTRVCLEAEAARPYTAPPDAGCSPTIAQRRQAGYPASQMVDFAATGETRSTEVLVAQTAEAEAEAELEVEDDADEADELLAQASTRLYQLQNSWAEERREAAALLWQQLHSQKQESMKLHQLPEDCEEDTEELGELEDIEKVRELDRRTMEKAAEVASAESEALSLIGGFRLAASTACGDLDMALATFTAAEVRAEAAAEAEAQAYLQPGPGLLENGPEEESGSWGAEAEAAAGPPPNGRASATCSRWSVEAAEADVLALCEEASRELEGARARRRCFESRPGTSSGSAPSTGGVRAMDVAAEWQADNYLLDLQQDVERLKARAAWQVETEAEEAEADRTSLAKMQGGLCWGTAAAAASASPCRRRATASTMVSAASEFPSCPSSPSAQSADARSPASRSAGDTPPELAVLGRWVDDLRRLASYGSAGAEGSARPAAISQADSEATALGKLTADARGSASPSSPSRRLTSSKNSSPPKAGALCQNGPWTTSAKSPGGRSTGAGEADAAAGSPMRTRQGIASLAAGGASPRSPTAAAQTPPAARASCNSGNMEAQLDEILREFDEIDRIHGSIRKMSCWSR